MMSTGAQAVLDRMESDEAFAQRVKDAGGPEASLELLEREGFEVSAQDMRDALIDRYGDHLTNEQLDALVAGELDPNIAGGLVMFGFGMVVVGAAAAAAI